MGFAEWNRLFTQLDRMETLMSTLSDNQAAENAALTKLNADLDNDITVGQNAATTANTALAQAQSTIASMTASNAAQQSQIDNLTKQLSDAAAASLSMTATINAVDSKMNTAVSNLNPPAATPPATPPTA